MIPIQYTATDVGVLRINEITQAHFRNTTPNLQ